MIKSFSWHKRYTVLAVMVIVQLGLSADKMVLSVAIPYISKEYHLSPLAMGAAMSAFFASYALSQVPGGLLADRFGVRIVATLALVWSATFAAITGAAGSFYHLIFARFGAGMGEGAYPACTYKTIATWYQPEARASATGVLLASAQVGGALAPLMVVPIIVAWGWRAVFLLLSAVGVLASLLFWSGVRDRSDVAANSPVGDEIRVAGTQGYAARRPRAFAHLLQQVARADALNWFVMTLLFDFVIWGYKLWLPTYLVQIRNFTSPEMARAAALCSLAGVPGSIVGGKLADGLFRNHRRSLILIAQAFSALAIYMTFATASYVALYLWLFVAGFFLIFFFSAFWALPMSKIKKEDMGTMSGFINMAGQVAAFISPLIIGYFVQVNNGTFRYAMVALLAALACSSLLALFPTDLKKPDNRSRRTAASIAR